VLADAQDFKSLSLWKKWPCVLHIFEETSDYFVGLSPWQRASRAYWLPSSLRNLRTHRSPRTSPKPGSFGCW